MRLASKRRAAFVASFALVAMLPLTFAACTNGDDDSHGDDAHPTTDATVPESSASDASVDADADANSRGDAAPSTCSDAGFCRSALPVHEPLLDVTATSVDDAWSIGAHTVLHWDGTDWRTLYEYQGSSSNFTLIGIWAGQSNDVWALAAADFQAIVLRYSALDGGAPAFRQIMTEEELSPWGGASAWLSASSGELWMVKNPDGIVRRVHELDDGTMAFDDVTPTIPLDDPSMYFTWQTVWGFGPNDVYVGGYECLDVSCGDQRGAIAHWDGTSWSPTTLDTTDRVTTLIGTQPGAEPRRLWMALGLRAQLRPVESDGGIGAPLFEQSIFADSFDQLRGSAPTASAAWLSNGSLVYRWDGAKLVLQAVSPNALPAASVDGLWGGSSGEAWIVGEFLQHGPDAPKQGFAALRKGDGP